MLLQNLLDLGLVDLQLGGGALPLEFEARLVGVLRWLCGEADCDVSSVLFLLVSLLLAFVFTFLVTSFVVTILSQK